MAQKDGSVQNETFVARIKDAVPVAEGKKKFTVYLTEVTPPWFYNVPSYTVHRRYREFLMLYKDLCGMFGKGEITVAFPKKKALGSMGAATVSHRKAALQQFFEAVAAHEKMGKHKLMQDFLAHRPGADPPKPAPSVKKERARTAQPQSKEDVDEKTIVAGSKRQGAAAAMRVAAATPGMKSAAAAPTNQPPVHDDVDADADARTAAKAEAKKKAKATAEAEQARAKADAARKSKAEAEKKKAETERKQKEADERRATEARKAAASPPAKSTAPQATSVVTPAAAAPAGGAADWPTLAGVPARLVKEAERCLTDGNFGGAAEGFDEAISSLEDAEPKFDVVRCDLYVKRADCLLHDGQPRQAAEDCTKALALNPIHHEALLRRGRAMQQREKFQDAFTDFQQCVLLKASNERAGRHGMQEVSKMLEQMGEGSWVRKNRRV